MARAAPRARWRESWEHATPTSWGRPIGAIKAALIAGRRRGRARRTPRWALGLGARGGRVADRPLRGGARAARARALGRGRGAWPRRLQGRDDFPPAVADALAAIAAGDATATREAVEAVLASFEARDEYLEDVAVADTVLVLQALARSARDSRRAAALGGLPV